MAHSGKTAGESVSNIIHNGYLQDQAVRIGSIASLLVLWWIATFFYPPVLLPEPVATFERTLELFTTGEFFDHFWPTFYRVIVAFVVTMILATLLGIMMGFNNFAEKFLETYVLIGLTIPGLAVAIICLMILGLNNTAAIIAIVVTIFPIITESMWEGAKNIDRRLIRMGHAFNVSRRRITTDIILPQLIPYLLAASRYGLALSWKLVVIVELLGLSNGIGFKINEAYTMFSLLNVLAWTLSFTLVMFILEFGVIKWVERHLTRWRPDVEGGDFI